MYQFDNHMQSLLALLLYRNGGFVSFGWLGSDHYWEYGKRSRHMIEILLTVLGMVGSPHGFWMFPNIPNLHMFISIPIQDSITPQFAGAGWVSCQPLVACSNHLKNNGFLKRNCRDCRCILMKRYMTIVIIKDQYPLTISSNAWWGIVRDGEWSLVNGRSSCLSNTNLTIAYRAGFGAWMIQTHLPIGSFAGLDFKNIHSFVCILNIYALPI